MSDQFIPINDDLIKDRLKDLTEEHMGVGRTEVPAAELRYREAAAVLSSFDPRHIKPVALPEEETQEDEAARSALLTVSEPVYTEGGESRWTLQEPVRVKTLQQLGTKQAIARALEANRLSSEDDPLQRMLLAYASRSLPPLDQQSLDELLATAQLVQWLQPILPGLPELQSVLDQIELRKLLTPLRELVGEHFYGRRAELARLRDYVGVLSPGTAGKSVRRRLWHDIGSDKGPPLCISGPGGIGKSTLLAKLVLDYVDVDASRRLPFVYLDFDRPGLVAQEPLTLLLESTRQMGVQYPAVRERTDHLRQGLLDRLASPELRLLRVAGHGARSDRLRGFIDPEPFLQELAEVTNQAVPERPVLFMLDRFELVQREGFDPVRGVWEFLDGLRALLPRLRIILAGRASIEDMPVQNLTLSEFDREAARGYLAALLAPDVVLDDEIVAEVVNQLGGSPLSLGLAAEVIRRNELSGEIDRATRTRVFGIRMGQEQIQSLLYRRLLDHIADANVRRLVFPGLVVRRLTPTVIRYVLAKPIGIVVTTDERAEELFQACAREVAILSMAADGSLHHRPDVRRVMLRFIRADRPDAVRQIHRRAVSFYRQQGDRVSRAEEIYHRLSLGQSSKTIDKRWKPGIEPYLQDAIDELPPHGQAYLASRLGITLDPAVVRQVDS